MKKLNMLRVLIAAVLVATFALGPRLVYGQQAKSAPDPAPIVEHLKIENGEIWIREPGQAMVNTHDSAIVGNAIKALQKIYPDITIAADPRTINLSLADVIVRANDPATDLEALRTASGDRFDVKWDKSVNPRSATGNPQIDLLYTIRANTETDAHPEAEERIIECFNLTGYIQHAVDGELNRFNRDPKPDNAAEKDRVASVTDNALAELQEIIKSTIKDFDSSIKEPKFRFYADAQLLIMTGSPQAINIAAKVVSALPGQQGTRWTSNGDGSSRNQQLLRQMGVTPDSPTKPSVQDPTRQ
jgi:hypothetical protein